MDIAKTKIFMEYITSDVSSKRLPPQNYYGYLNNNIENVR